jgi:hypothetical protein
VKVEIGGAAAQIELREVVDKRRRLYKHTHVLCQDPCLEYHFGAAVIMVLSVHIPLFIDHKHRMPRNTAFQAR